MKAIFILSTFCIVSSTLFAKSPDTLYVSDNMSLYIMFESNVQDIDVGNQDYVWLKKENMALVKAKSTTSKPTSLMIRTSSNVHVWWVCYRKDLKNLLVDTRVKVQPDNNQTILNPANSNAVASNSINQKPTPQLTRNQDNAQSLQEYVKRAEEKYKDFKQPEAITKRTETGNRDFAIKDDLMQRKIYSIFEKERVHKNLAEINNGLYFSLLDIHVDRQYIYFRFEFYNTSSIAFDIDFLSLEIEGKKSIKRRQSNPRKLVQYQYKESVLSIYPQLAETIVIVTDIFSCNDTDKLVFKINELGGTRTLSFNVPGKNISQSKSL